MFVPPFQALYLFRLAMRQHPFLRIIRRIFMGLGDLFPLAFSVYPGYLLIVDPPDTLIRRMMLVVSFALMWGIVFSGYFWRLIKWLEKRRKR